MPDDADAAAVQAAAAAAEDVVFSRVERSAVEDLDVTVSLEDGTLTVEVYVEAPEAGVDVEQVADDAALAARRAADDVLG